MEGETEATLVSSQELLRESDFLSLHAPLNSDSQLALGADQFALMKREHSSSIQLAGRLCRRKLWLRL